MLTMTYIPPLFLQAIYELRAFLILLFGCALCRRSQSQSTPSIPSLGATAFVECNPITVQHARISNYGDTKRATIVSYWEPIAVHRG
jgi:hypothetical protein